MSSGLPNEAQDPAEPDGAPLRRFRVPSRPGKDFYRSADGRVYATVIDMTGSGNEPLLRQCNPQTLEFIEGDYLPLLPKSVT